MATQQRERILIEQSVDPSQFILIILIFLASMVVGLIPIIYGVGDGNTPTIVPSEAELWRD